jgi:NAD(P)-dependent dehydrogenase (short-subunit alcohol dehydrogenase family)
MDGRRTAGGTVTSSLHGRTAIVTGAASGIGRAIAMEFAAKGARVVIFDVETEAARDTVEAIVAAGGKALALDVDVSNIAQVDGAVAGVLTRYGSIDVLCNNAGVMDRMAPAHTLPPEEWEHVMAVNARGPYATCHAVLPSMLERRSGAIVNIASIAGLTGGRAGAAYTASKHAVIGLTKSMAWTYVDYGIRCNAICPGGIRTPIMRNIDIDEGLGVERLRLPGATKPRQGEPDEIAAAAVFLASDQASFVNGSIIPVDGGWMVA